MVVIKLLPSSLVKAQTLLQCLLVGQASMDR